MRLGPSDPKARDDADEMSAVLSYAEHLTVRYVRMFIGSAAAVHRMSFAMAKVIMTSSAFATALSEEVGERSGLAIDRAALFHHLGPHSVFWLMLSSRKTDFSASMVDYADAIGHLLFALGAIEQPGMPSLGTRLIDRLGRGAALTMDIDRLLSVEAIANHALAERQRSGASTRNLCG